MPHARHATTRQGGSCENATRSTSRSGGVRGESRRMWNSQSSSDSTRMSWASATTSVSAASQTMHRVSSYAVILSEAKNLLQSWLILRCALMTALRNRVVLHLAVVEPRDSKDIAFRVDPDVRGRAHVGDERCHVRAAVDDVHGAVSPARHQDALRHDFDAVVLTGTRDHVRRRGLPCRPRLDVRDAKGREDEPVVGGVPRYAVRAAE